MIRLIDRGLFSCVFDQFFSDFEFQCQSYRGDIDTVFKYLNRLSDYLFTAARYVSHKDGVPEEIYTRQTLDDS